MDETIQNKIKEFYQNAENEKTTQEEDNLTFCRTKTVIEILLEHYHEISHEQIRDELITILIGNFFI